jgi:predicted ATPase with chaperone activity
LKIARTLADLAGKENIPGSEMLEAIQFRSAYSSQIFQTV